MKSKDQTLLEEAYTDVRKNESYHQKLNKLALELETDTETIERIMKIVAADIADFCCDIDGGDNMFSRGIRQEYGIE
jgi:hypothetical protein